MSVKLTVNGKLHELDVEADTPLLWVLRDNLGLTGTKFGCGVMACGACAVLVDGVATRSCGMPVGKLAAAQGITTIEGLPGVAIHPVQKAWAALNVAQCGYCQSGMIMAALALLEKNPDPSDADIDTHITNLCRCGTYPLIRSAIKQAAREMRHG